MGDPKAVGRNISLSTRARDANFNGVAPLFAIGGVLKSVVREQLRFPWNRPNLNGAFSTNPPRPTHALMGDSDGRIADLFSLGRIR